MLLEGENMHPIKYVWALRALIYKPFFKHLGSMTYIGKPCFIEGCKGISIGKRTRIFPGVRMEAIGTGEITIGNNCAIEQNVHIISQGRMLNIGNDTTISANVFISNVDHRYEDITKSVMDQHNIEKETVIGDGCFIGFGSTVMPGTKLGKHCVVGAGSVVKGEFPNYCVIVGSPAKIIKQYRENEWKRTR